MRMGLENKYHLMAKSRLQELTKPAVFVTAVAKQHDVSSLRHGGVAIFGVLVSVRAVF